MATATPKKISDLYSALTNPSGSASGAQPFIDLLKGLQVKGPILNPTPAPNMSTVKGPVYAPPPTISAAAAPAPNMSTVKGPVYAPPPTLSAFAAGAPTPTRPVVTAPGPVAPPAPVVPPPVSGPTGATGPAAPTIPPHWLRADGSLKTPTEVAADIATTVKAGSEVGDVGRLAAEQFNTAPKTAEDLKTDVRRINNTRNDIAVGEIDPYKVASESGVAYTPAELSAIEKAYAGIYDPALNTAMAKLETKQSQDAADASAAAKAKADAAAPFTLGKDQVRYDGQGNPIAVGLSDTGNGGTLYVAGANPTVDAYVQGFKNGTYKAGDIPDEYKGLVAQGVAATKPAISKASNDAISVINEIQGSDILGQISGIPNVSTFIPGTKAQTLLNLTKQLKGILSLENRQQLKGSGAISDFEFRVLGDAASSLGIGEGGRTNLSESEFVDQLNKLKLKLSVGQTELTDDELLFLQSKGYTPEQIREYNQEQSFNGVGNTIASTGEGNRPQRNNNPGNVKAGGLADSLAVGKDDQNHLVFPDAATGLKALTLDLTAKVNGASKYLPANPTIAELGKVYAEDPNWSIKVAQILGVPVNTHTQTVSIDKLAKAVATQEGFYA